MPQGARPPRSLVLVVLTALTLIAFAANSLLCRAALGENRIDAASFTLIQINRFLGGKQKHIHGTDVL